MNYQSDIFKNVMNELVTTKSYSSVFFTDEVQCETFKLRNDKSLINFAKKETQKKKWNSFINHA